MNLIDIINKMKILILAGGEGIRLRPFTFSIPKPLIPIGDTPILEILIKQLKSQGFREIILSLGYNSDLIENYFGDGKKFGLNIKYIKENKRMGTAGPIRMAKEKFRIKEPIMVLNGDLFTKTNFKKIFLYHKRNKSDFTIGIKEDKIKIKYGVYEIKNNKVISIKEKPTLKIKVSIGINILNPDVVDLIPKNKMYDMPSLINNALKKRKKISSYIVKEFWMAIDRLIDLEEAQKIMRQMKK